MANYLPTQAPAIPEKNKKNNKALAKRDCNKKLLYTKKKKSQKEIINNSTKGQADNGHKLNASIGTASGDRSNESQLAASSEELIAGRKRANPYSGQKPSKQKSDITIFTESFIISTYNVRTLNKAGRQHQLCMGAIEYGIPIIALQEIRLKTKKEFEIKRCYKDTFVLIFISADEYGNGGVGFLVKKEYANKIKSIQKISSRCLALSFGFQPTLTVVSVYAPTELAKEEPKDNFYCDLDEFISKVPKNNLLCVAGDFNAHIGFDSHKVFPKTIGNSTYYETSNDNGNRLVDFCVANSLRPCLTKFKHRKGRKSTWTHPTGSEAQIDHILINQKWENSIKNCRSYNTVNVNSDHKIVSVKVKLSLKTFKKVNKPKIFPDYEQLRKSKLQRQNFENKNNKNIKYDGNISTQENFNIFEKNIKENMKTIPPKPKIIRSDWLSLRSKLLIKERDSAKQKYQKHKREEDKRIYTVLQEKVDKQCKDDQVKFYQKMCDNLTKAKTENNMKEVYKYINIFSGNTKSNSANFTKNLDGTISKDMQERLANFRQYFVGILNNINKREKLKIMKAKDILPINTGDFTLKEVEDAIKSFKNNKAPGIDDIPAEISRART